MGKLTGMIAGAALTFGVGVAGAGETPQVLGAADYQAMSTGEMSSVTGERNRNINFNFTRTVCTPAPNCQIVESSSSVTNEQNGVNTNTNVNFASVVSTQPEE